MRRLACLALCLLVSTALTAATTANDDSCDISVTPAATLLLPYFEVDFTAPASTALTTLFTITNTSHLPQIARATIWTDWGFPAFTFDLFLTGYDVASVNLYDFLARGALPKTIGETPGELSAGNTTNPNHLVSMPLDCATRPTAVSETMLRDLRSILTNGRTSTGLGISCASASGQHQQVGSNHGPNAVGYITIDLVATCSSTLPDKAEYFLNELLYDNVLIGDWMMISPNRTTGNYAGGAPLVHIRAIPEGGPAGSIVPTHLPFTFHDRLTYTLPSTAPRSMDRRQPLPSTFAARYIQGGEGSFETKFVIWRESTTGAGSLCTQYVNNANQEISEVVRFDEHENAIILGGGVIICAPAPGSPGTPSTWLVSTTSQIFPFGSFASGDVGGWMYLNLSNGGSLAYTVNGQRDFKTDASVFPWCQRHNQNWVSTFMYAEGRYAVAHDPAPLANGCSKSPVPGARIAPGANVTP